MFKYILISIQSACIKFQVPTTPIIADSDYCSRVDGFDDANMRFSSS